MNTRRELATHVMHALAYSAPRLAGQRITLHPRKPRIKVRRGGRVYVITVKEKRS